MNPFFVLFCHLFHLQTSLLYLLIVTIIVVSCLTLLLLHNKVPLNLVAQDSNKHLLSLTVSMDLEVAKLGGFWLGVFLTRL